MINNLNWLEKSLNETTQSMLQNKQKLIKVFANIASNIFFKGSVDAFYFFCSFTFLRVFFFLFFRWQLLWHCWSGIFVCLAKPNQTLHIHEIQTYNVFPLEQQTVLLHSKNRSHLTWTLILLTVLKRTIKYFLSSTALACLSRFHNFF